MAGIAITAKDGLNISCVIYGARRRGDIRIQQQRDEERRGQYGKGRREYSDDRQNIGLPRVHGCCYIFYGIGCGTNGGYSRARTGFGGVASRQLRGGAGGIRAYRK